MTCDHSWVSSAADGELYCEICATEARGFATLLNVVVDQIAPAMGMTAQEVADAAFLIFDPRYKDPHA